MSPQDLMIGNLVEVKVSCYPHGIGEIRGIGLGNIVVSIDGTSCVYLYEDIQGIPVTGPNLEKIGMTRFDEKSEYWEKYKDDKNFCVSISKHNEPSAGVEIGKAYHGYEFIELTYIHQVQSLMKFK